MPLPTNSSLSLIAAARPGDPMSLKPKKAMLLRMSSETLDALESSQTEMQFQFGDNPGLFIGQSYFPMNHSQESGHHDIYLRAPSVVKKNAPLKLYATIVGKFSIEQKELAAGLRDKIRESTQDAAALRNSRTTVFMETPPDTQPSTAAKKKKHDTMFRKPIRPSDKVTPSPLPPPPAKPSTSTTSTTTSRDGVPVRARFVHCLASGDKTEEQLFKMLGAPERSTGLRAEISDLLEQLAEFDSSRSTYKLRPLAWKEVRPFDWPGWSEGERVNVGRIGRTTLKNLRIPETDSLWEHFRYKNPQSTANSSAQTTSSEPKRGVTSKQMKDKKTKPKADPKAEIMMKDESARALLDGDDAKSRRQLASAPSKSSKSSAKQELPSTSLPREKAPTRQEASSSSTFSRPINVKSEDKPSVPLKVTRMRQDIAASDSERERSKFKERPVKRDMDDGTRANVLAKRKALEDGDHGEMKKVARRHVVDDVGHGFPKSKQKTRGGDDDEDDRLAKPAASMKKKKPVDEDEYEDSRRAGSSKRKTVGGERYEDSEYRSKKRKTDEYSISSREDRDRMDVGKKTLSNTRKRSLSPPRRPSLNTRDTDVRSGMKSSSTNSKTVTKTRRKSPVFTSSEDEPDDVPLIKKKREFAGTTAHNTNGSSGVGRHSHSSRHLVQEHAREEERYADLYMKHLSNRQTIYLQRTRIHKMVSDRSGSASVTDSDTELLPPDEFNNLVGEEQRVTEELQKMLDGRSK